MDRLLACLSSDHRLGNGIVTVPLQEDLEIRLHRAFWINPFPDSVFSQLLKIQGKVRIVELVDILASITPHEKIRRDLLGCYVSNANTLYEIFQRMVATYAAKLELDDIQLEHGPPDTAAYEKIAKMAPAAPQTIPDLVGGLGGKTYRVAFGVDALYSYGPLSIPFLLDGVLSSNEWTRVECANLLNELATMINEDESTRILENWRAEDINNTKLKMSLLSIAVKAWRINPTEQDMNLALDQIDALGSNIELEDLHLCLLMAEIASKGSEDFHIRTLVLLEKNCLEWVDKRLESLILTIGSFYLKNFSLQHGLTTTLESTSKRFTLRPQFTESSFKFLFVEANNSQVWALPQPWLPYVQKCASKRRSRD